MDNDHSLEIVKKRPAKSNKVSYGDPTILYESKQTKQVLIPFFIPRSEGADLSIKIITYSKNAHGLVEVQDKSISLNETASRILLSALKNYFAITDENDGNYLLIKLNEGTAAIETLDPKKVLNALISTLSQKQILNHLKDAELTSELIASLKTSIKLKEMRMAAEELRTHLEMGEASEAIYQCWCEKHTWVFGNSYIMRDDIREITPSDHLDLILSNVIAGYRDIVELKRPDMKVLHWDDTHKNFYFSSDVSKSIGQCHRYLDVFHEVAANGLRDHPEK